MNVHRTIEGRPHAPTVLSIGFFDGMHRGHQQIARVTRTLRRPGWRAAVLSFANHPATYLRPGTEPQLITSAEERLNLFRQYGYEECFFVSFDASIATIAPDVFVSDLLLRRLDVHGVVVGDTFRFGRDRAGDVGLLREILDRDGVPFRVVPQVTDRGRISSTRIRGLIAEGDVEEADRLLGHAFELRGTVEMGAGRGGALGFPTANLNVPAKLMPCDGVYAATARHDGRDYAALVSIGDNPTFDGRLRTIEVWLRDFEQTIYGHELAVRDLRFVRAQRRFDSAAELIQQMRDDARAVPFPSFT